MKDQLMRVLQRAAVLPEHKQVLTADSYEGG